MTDTKGEMSQRQKVWLEAWIAIAASSSCMRHGVATEWADVCLKEFDKRFPRGDLK